MKERRNSLEGERDRPGRNRRHLAADSTVSRCSTENVFGQRPKTAGGTPALPGATELAACLLLIAGILYFTGCAKPSSNEFVGHPSRSQAAETQAPAPKLTLNGITALPPQPIEAAQSGYVDFASRPSGQSFYDGGFGGRAGLGISPNDIIEQRVAVPIYNANPYDVAAALEGRSVSPISPLATAALSAEEVWIIARSADSTAPPSGEYPGSGSLLAKLDQKEVPMPLKHTDVKASVSGYIGAVEVTQQFQNPYNQKIEAVYVFPLPHNAAVNEFIMTIGDRRIRGIIRDRKEAEQIYQQAKQQGYVASLLTEERPNIFTQSVANIEPGKEIDVDIKYFQTLDYSDGWYEFVFPMVVGPRFNPPGMTNGIGHVAVGAHGASGQKTEVQYLKPSERSGHDISLRLDVDTGVPIEEFECKTHAITKGSSDAEHLTVSLNPNDTIPNKDFVLRYRVAGGKIKSSLLTQRDERGGYFTLMLFPPMELGNLTRQPLELVFVLDCSGSMSRGPIEQAKAAVARGLRLLRPGDSFQLINFSTSASQLGSAPLEATPENIQRGLNYLASLNGDGGTMMIEGIKAALDFPHDPHRLRFVCFLTDGYIGNEAEILGEIHKRLGASRIFNFGIGSSVNRYLIDHMGKVGRGAVAYLGLHDDAAKIMEDFFERISHPALTDIQIDWGAMQTSEIYPREMPDLFVGRPVILTGRFNGSVPDAIRVTGKAAGASVDLRVPTDSTDASQTNSALASVWARMKIADLANQSTYAPDAELPDAIKKVALDYGLMSAFTAFVAVDSSRVTEGNEGVTVPVAVPVPEGVKYETTVQEK